MTKPKDDEIAKRRDNALRRALQTPPELRKKATGDASKASPEPDQKAKREK